MIDKLKILIDKTFSYKGNIITIKDVKLVSTTYVVKTDKRTYNFFESEVDIFISDLKNVSMQEKKDELKPYKMEESERNIVPIQETDLKVILLETINKVRTNKEYIGQANAICNVVTQMINVQKLEIQLKNNFKK